MGMRSTPSPTRSPAPHPRPTTLASTGLSKAAGSRSAGSRSPVKRQEPERPVLFHAAADDAGDLVADLIRVSGYEWVRVGGLDQSIRIEMLGDLREVGALGRVVTKPKRSRPSDLARLGRRPPACTTTHITEIM